MRTCVHARFNSTMPVNLTRLRCQLVSEEEANEDDAREGREHDGLHAHPCPASAAVAAEQSTAIVYKKNMRVER